MTLTFTNYARLYTEESTGGKEVWRKRTFHTLLKFSPYILTWRGGGRSESRYFKREQFVNGPYNVGPKKDNYKLAPHKVTCEVIQDLYYVQLVSDSHPKIGDAKSKISVIVWILFEWVEVKVNNQTKMTLSIYDLRSLHADVVGNCWNLMKMWTIQTDNKQYKDLVI